MRQLTQDLPVAMEGPGMQIHNAQWGDMVIGYLELPGGTDFTPLFRGVAR